MLVYRDDGEPIEPAREWARLRRQVSGMETSAPHAAVTALLIELGELEAAIADALFPERDGLDALAGALRLASLSAARVFVASWQNEPVGAALSALQSALDRVPEQRLPHVAIRRVSEGYAYYAVHPETYAAAAARFAREADPPFAVCLGIRSIGTSLSAVVGAALERAGVPVEVWSVRPRGHPFERRLRLGTDFEQRLRQTPPGTHYLVVDEGPGLSGSSFAAVAAALADLPASSVAFFPSWNADGSSFRSDAARAIWVRHRRWLASTQEARTGLGAILCGASGVDMSAGAWRQTLAGPEQEWPAVHPQHERVKVWLRDRGEMLRFAGLGAYGAARRERALVLAEAGLGPVPGALRQGYLTLPFVEGRPCTAADAADERLLAAAARHIAFAQQAFPSRRAPAFDDVCAMIDTNIREAEVALAVPSLERFRHAIEEAPAAGIDGRMLAHEWLRTPEGFVKTDALDHSSDHFFPGAQDAAWDLAACEAELGLGPDAASRLRGLYEAASGDRTVDLRLEFYRIAYAAMQVGYATLARQSLDGSEEARRFERRRELFAGRLRALLAR